MRSLLLCSLTRRQSLLKKAVTFEAGLEPEEVEEDLEEEDEESDDEDSDDDDESEDDDEDDEDEEEEEEGEEDDKPVEPPEERELLTAGVFPVSDSISNLILEPLA